MLHNIAHVRGFTCWGAHIGIKSKRRDLALLYSETPAHAAAVFTRNLIVSECVKISREHIKDNQIQAIVINSSNANTCTGNPGWLAANKMAEVTAECLHLDKKLVFVASTGIIGKPFPLEKVEKGIRENTANLSSRHVAGSLAANAILTTDTFPKEGFISFEIDGKDIFMGGIAKGSGMIHPNMGTMLGFILCDIALAAPLLDKALKEAVNKTFNMITVDGDTSTNDMVVVLCNGAAGNHEITQEDAHYAIFKEKLSDLCEHLAKMIVSDGEGATKFIEYQVVNAPEEASARQIVRVIADSNLVKTAMFGKDPNWGRIIAAAGNAGVDFNPDLLDLYIESTENIKLVEKGQPIQHHCATLKKLMDSPHIRVILNLNQGESNAKGWGSDLSYEYVRINAEYTT